MNTKNLLVLARRDHAEGMRVAAGLTIAGHDVKLVFMDRVVEDSEENAEQVETLELCDIEPVTTVANDDIPEIDDAKLSMWMLEADSVISL